MKQGCHRADHKPPKEAGGRMKNDIRFYFESKNGYMIPVFVQNPYRPEQIIEKYKLTYIKYEDAE